MKTNKVMIRQMGNLTVNQRISDAMFNATDLLKQWNNSNPNEIRRLDTFWESTHLDKLMYEIAVNELNFNSRNFGELKKALSTINEGKYGGTWMHPILFIKFAMYLSPKFEYHVLKFVSDQLIEFRHKSGDSYNVLGSATKDYYLRNHNRVPTDLEYKEIAALIQLAVLGKTHNNHTHWEKATEAQLKLRDNLEKVVAYCFNNNYSISKTIDEIDKYKAMNL